MKRLIAATVGALVCTASLAVGLAPAHAEAGTATVSPTVGAWYQTSPVCAVPVGCGSSATVTSYPADTLHVGATAGQEAARAYLGFSSAALSADVTAVGGQLVIPVDPDAGTAAPDTAALQVCLVLGALAAPAPAAAPPVDCTVSTPAAYLAGTPSVFVADLAPLLAKHAGTLDGLAVALVPTPQTAGAATLTTTWHVALSAPGRKGGTPPVLAQLDLAPASAPPVGPPVVQPPAVPGPPAVALPPVTSGVVPPAAVQPPTLAQGPAPGQASVVPRAFLVKGHRFGVLWAMPFGLFLLGWAFVSTSSRDLRSYTRAVPRG